MFMANNPVIKQRSKHIKTDIYFVRELVLQKHIQIKHICTSQQLADLFTKTVNFDIFVKLGRKLKK